MISAKIYRKENNYWRYKDEFDFFFYSTPGFTFRRLRIQEDHTSRDEKK